MQAAFGGMPQRGMRAPAVQTSVAERCQQRQQEGCGTRTRAAAAWRRDATRVAAPSPGPRRRRGTHGPCSKAHRGSAAPRAAAGRS